MIATPLPSAQSGRSTPDIPEKTSSSGRVYFWQGASLWLGRGQGRTQWHDHHAHQLALALDGAFRFRSAADGEWSDYRGALVLSHSKHQFEVNDVRIAHLFVEPESRAGRALVACYGRSGVCRLPEALVATPRQLLADAQLAGLVPPQMIETAARALALLCGGDTGLATELDPRLARALQYIRAHIRSPLTLPAVAAAVHLSESRFRHLFVAETGSSFRAYLLWLRLNIAIEAAMAGASWTEAAHEAGFADSAHLSRTHKRMFGIEPTSVRPT